MTDRLYQLLTLYRQGLLNQEQVRELASLLSNEMEAEAFAMLIQEELVQKEVVLPGELQQTEDRMLNNLQRKISKDAGQPHAKVRRLHKRWYWVAASLLLVAGFMVWLQTGKPPVQPTITANEKIHPGSNGAMLTLADGRTLALDSLTDGTIATENGVNVVMNEGNIIYKDANTGSDSLQFNTMTTPNGKQFSLLLPDGTRVWLNAGTSLKYPTRFNQKERKVILDGEAYFEVKKSTVPFLVNLGNSTELEVLGTSFNANNYKEEPAKMATLVEGAVLIKNEVEAVKLAPGQQAAVSNTIKVHEADLEKVIAWKNGIFYCEGVGLREMMRQIGRWYDIEIDYTPGVPDIKFTGKMSRNVQLSDLLSALERSGVRFKLEGRKLIVMP